jgi:hypothetical protein
MPVEEEAEDIFERLERDLYDRRCREERPNSAVSTTRSSRPVTAELSDFREDRMGLLRGHKSGIVPNFSTIRMIHIDGN